MYKFLILILKIYTKFSHLTNSWFKFENLLANLETFFNCNKYDKKHTVSIIFDGKKILKIQKYNW